MSEKIQCTVGILTKNSGKTLERALESVKDFDDIVICDGDSTDNTIDIAKKFGARIIAQNKQFRDADGYINDYSAVRNQLVETAQYEWFFWIDSDEYASPQLIESVRSIVSSRQDGAFNAPRRYIHRGRQVEIATSYPNTSMRLFSKRSATGFRKIVHERPKLKAGVQPEAIEGYVFVPVEADLANVFRRNDRYIALEVKRKGRVGIMRFVGYARGELRTTVLYLFRLIRNYLFRRGTRLPLSMELARHRYTFRLLRGLWRARRAKYPPVVLFVLNKWKRGGAEHVMLQEIQSLSRQGVALKFCALYGDEIPPDLDKKATVFPQFKYLLDVPAYIRLLTTLGEEQVTHIFATLEHAMIVSRLAAIFAPSVKVFIAEPGMADRKPWRYKILDILLNWRVKIIVSVSNGVQRSLLKYQPMYAKKMRVLFNGVDVPTTLPLRSEESRFTVLGVGSLRTEKGFEILADAFDLFLKETKADAQLIIAGEGPLRAALEKKNVQLLGELPHEEILAWYRRANCFVLSSISEGNPNVVLEALSQGTPTIATKVSGAEDMITDSESGLLVPPGSRSALSEAIKKLYADPALRRELGEKGFERVHQFSFENHMRELKNILGI